MGWYGYGGSSFVLIVVLFVLLIIKTVLNQDI